MKSTIGIRTYESYEYQSRKLRPFVGDLQEWKVTCIVDPNDANDIIGFTVPLQVGNSTLNTMSHTVTFHMPYGTSVIDMIATITLSKEATLSPASGISQNFTTPVSYTVTAENETSQPWTVTCIVDMNNANDITGFTVPDQVGDPTITTKSHTLTFHMPYGTSVNSLTPTLNVSIEATISPSSGGTQNFTKPITYTVTAQNGVKQAWKATCIVDKNSANDITGLTIPNQIGNATIDSTNHTVEFHMLYGTSVIRLAPAITLSAGATIRPGSKSTQNFTKTVTYKVKAQNGTSVKWKVTCIVGQALTTAVTNLADLQLALANADITKINVNADFAIPQNVTVVIPSDKTVVVNSNLTVNGTIKDSESVSRLFKANVMRTLAKQ